MEKIFSDYKKKLEAFAANGAAAEEAQQKAMDRTPTTIDETRDGN
jgi:hypothetical protein